MIHSTYKNILLVLVILVLLSISLFLPNRQAISATLIIGVTERVSVSSSGEQGSDGSYEPSISEDGRFVAFGSYASNLVSGDTNGEYDIFVRDRQSGMTELISVSSSGDQGNVYSNYPSISADGRFVAFQSKASNLVSGDTNEEIDIFVRDRQSGVTERVSVSSSGEQGNEYSFGSFISADGLFVVFASRASNLVSGDTNGDWDVFVRDRQSGVTELISVSSSGDQGNGGSDWPSISADRRFVAFGSAATNLVSGDTNGKPDIFIRDRQSGVTEQISVSSSSEQGNDKSYGASISADGFFVTFYSNASNLVNGDTNSVTDVFIRNPQSGVTDLISVSSSGEEGNGWSNNPSISADGRFVAFHSYASNLVSGDTNGTHDVFVRDRWSGVTELISLSSINEQGNGNSYSPSISSDGHFVAFHSDASNLVSGDTNGVWDIFVRDRCLDGSSKAFLPLIWK